MIPFCVQTKIAEEFALKIREFGRAMFFEQPANETQNWAKHPLFLVSRLYILVDHLSVEMTLGSAESCKLVNFSTMENGLRS